MISNLFVTIPKQNFPPQTHKNLTHRFNSDYTPQRFLTYVYPFLNKTFKTNHYFRPSGSRQHQVFARRRWEEPLRPRVGGPVDHPHLRFQAPVPPDQRKLHPELFQRRQRQSRRLDRGVGGSVEQRRSLLFRKIHHRKSRSGFALPRPDF